MELKCQHAVVRVTSVKEAKEFYINILGLELLEETPNFYAAKSGGIRLSFFEGYDKPSNPEEVTTGVSLIFRVENLDTAIKEFTAKGVKFEGDIIDIPGVHKFQELEDPSGNVLFLAEYHKEPV